MAAPVTLQEYERLERAAQTRSEWIDGQILAMAGSSWSHVRIAKNLARAADDRIRGGPCESFSSELRVKTASLRAYPDLTIVCGTPNLDPDSPIATIDNPAAIFEVLSPTTAAYDFELKAEQYRTIPSLHDYVIVAQDACRVEYYARQADGRWLLSEWKSPDAVLELTGVELSIPLSEIFSEVTFSPPQLFGHDE